MISSRIVLPAASSIVQPNIRSAAAFHVVMWPSRSSVMNASGAVSRTSRVRSSELRSSSACSWIPPRRREIRMPATTGVPTASSQRTTTMSGSWIASTTAYDTATRAACASAWGIGKK